MTSAYSDRDPSDPLRISSFCTDGDCVGVSLGVHGVAVVDTKVSDRDPLQFTRSEWAAFVAGVKNGEFDLD